jgi:hypothetical protein
MAGTDILGYLAALSSHGKIRKYSEIRERGFQEINRVSELKKKEVVGNA